MAWTVTDRATRLSFFGCLLLAGLALLPVLAGDPSIPLMVLVLVLVYQAWRLAMSRHVVVRLDANGITKTVGTRTWHLGWEAVTALRLTRFLGAGHLVVRTTGPVAWTASDKLFWKLGRTEAAIQVPDPLQAELHAFLADKGMALA
jgi:hypothetical protein